MYREFFGFQRKPFQLTADPAFLYLSATHKKALAYLRYGIADAGNLVLLTGEIGGGKTTLLKWLIDECDEHVVVAKVMNTRVSGDQLLELIALDFGLDPLGKDKTTILHELNTFLIEQYGRGRKCLVAVDEAQNLDITMLEELRLLSNLESGADKLLQIILCGQPELRDTLNSPRLEQFKQRINVTYHLERLTAEETGHYIAHRLKVAGGQGVDFQPEAVAAIHRYAYGIPRLINKVCDRALLYGFVEERRDLNGDLVDVVLKDIRQEEGGDTAADREEEEVARRLSEATTSSGGLDSRTASLLWNRMQAVEDNLEEVAKAQEQILREVRGLPFHLEQELRKATQGLAKTVSSIWDKVDSMEARLREVEARQQGVTRVIEETGTQWSRTNDKLVPLLEQMNQVLDRHGAMLRRLSSLDLKEDRMLVRLDELSRHLDRLESTATDEGETAAKVEAQADSAAADASDSGTPLEELVTPSATLRRRGGGFFRRNR
jgi:putative secretion ATPase (PEP-CTERM system associated)